MKKMKTKFLPILFAATALLFGCEDSQNGSNPIDPSITAPVSMTVEWNDIYPGDSAPDGYVMLVGPYEYDFSRNTFDSIFPAGNDLEFIVYNEPLGIVFTNGIATLAEATRVAVNPERQPDNLYYGKGVYSLVEGEHADITIPTKRGTAPLTVRIAYNKTLAPSLSSEITASLSGVAATRNLHTGELSDEVVFHSTVTLDNSEDQFELNFNIFGVIGERQVVTLVVSDVNGNPTNISYDITSELQDFNTAMEPTVVDATLPIPIIEWELADISINNYPIGNTWIVNSPENPTLEELKGLKAVLSQVPEFSSIDLTLTGIKVLPDGVASHPNFDGALSRCNGLRSISMPDLTYIGASAFYDNNGLTSIDAKNVINLKDNAFTNCDILQSAELGAIDTVGEGAFSYCGSLITANFPNVVAVKSSGFNQCKKLENLTLSQDLTVLEYQAFGGCELLTSFSFPYVRELGSWVFSYCSKLTTIDLPMVTKLEGNAFFNCESLTTLNIGTGLTAAPTNEDIYIDRYAFDHAPKGSITLTVGYGTASGEAGNMTWTPETGSSFAGFNSVVEDFNY